MALINTEIPAQAFEVVRDQIGVILKNELANQAQITANFQEPEVFIDRFVNINQTQLPCVNVTIDRGSYQNQSVRHQYGVYSYQIEFYHLSNAGSTEGSQESARKCAELLGRTRAILMSSQYWTLNLKEPIIGRRFVEDFQIGNPEQSTADALSVSLAAMNFTVEVSETEALLNPQEIDQSWTTVLVKDGAYGYYWKQNT